MRSQTLLNPTIHLGHCYSRPGSDQLPIRLLPYSSSDIADEYPQRMTAVLRRRLIPKPRPICCALHMQPYKNRFRRGKPLPLHTQLHTHCSAHGDSKRRRRLWWRLYTSLHLEGVGRLPRAVDVPHPKVHPLQVPHLRAVSMPHYERN